MKMVYNLLLFFMVCLALFMSAQCSKDSSNQTTTPSPTGYPKQVSITYKVSSTSTNKATVVTYNNETGGISNETEIALPFAKTFTKTVNVNDAISLGYGTNTNQTIALDIFVNNVQVKTQTFQATSGALVYVFQ